MKRLAWLCAVLTAILILPSCSGSKSADSELEDRITSFLETVFGDQKIIDMDSVPDDELSRFAFHVGMYKGTIHERPVGLWEGLTEQQIEENILNVFGQDFDIDRLNYEYIMVERINDDGTYVPSLYGAPSYGLKYVIHGITPLEDCNYEAVVSYIDINADIVTFDSQGNRLPPDVSGNEMSNEERTKEIDRLKKKILANPEKYERVKLRLTVTDDRIALTGAEKIK